MQTTLKSEVFLAGVGLHSGRPARLTLRPAASGGIRFHRSDVRDRDAMIPARFDQVTDTTLSTRISNAAGVSVSTVEHLMAALAGTGLTHVRVEINGPEVPIMDGSSRRFVQAILTAGLRAIPGPLRAFRVERRIAVSEGAASAEITPAAMLSIDFEIDFPDAAIGRQKQRLSLVNGAFVHELNDCRTFCSRSDVEAMQAQGLALGGSLDNAVVVEGDRVLNPGGFRRQDECVRHKMLDAFGDLALAGAPILGAYRGVRAGHGMTNRLLRALFATPGAVSEVVLGPEAAALLPGVGLRLSDLRRTA